jgi:hypothetical protein
MTHPHSGSPEKGASRGDVPFILGELRGDVKAILMNLNNLDRRIDDQERRVDAALKQQEASSAGREKTAMTLLHSFGERLTKIEHRQVYMTGAGAAVAAVVLYLGIPEILGLLQAKLGG